MNTVFDINNIYSSIADELVKLGWSNEKISWLLSKAHLSVLSREEVNLNVKDIEHMISVCTACKGKGLIKETPSLKPIPGRGKSDTVDILFVGLMPGETEAQTGKIFTGPNSTIFTQAASESGIGKADCPAYLHNLVCCVPSSASPKAKQIQSCSLYLAELLYITNPNIVVTLGTEALSYMMGKKCKLKDYEGEVILVGKYIVVPLKHPSALHRIPEPDKQKSEMIKFKSQISGIKAMNDKLKKLKESGQLPLLSDNIEQINEDL